MINTVALTGRIVRDPETRTTNSGKDVASFTIAVNKRFKSPDADTPDADFFKVTCWDRTAEYVGNYLQKGRLVGIEGRLSSRKYTDKEGNNREVVEIVADNVTSLERPREDAAPKPSVHIPSSDEYDPFAED